MRPVIACNDTNTPSTINVPYQNVNDLQQDSTHTPNVAILAHLSIKPIAHKNIMDYF